MSKHPSLDLPAHDSYDPQAVQSADDDLMKIVLSPPRFPILDDLRSLSRLKTFEEMLSGTVDEDEDYRWLTEQGVNSSLQQ